MAANEPTDSTQTNEATTSTPSDSTQTNDATISTPSDSTKPIGCTTSTPSESTRPIGAKTSNNSTVPKKDAASMAATDTSSKKPAVTKEDDASSKNLLQQLPAGAVLAFQALAATFTNQGSCYTSNWWLTAGLVTFLSAACVIFPFTDTVIDKDGILRRGVALPSRLHIINLSLKEQRPMWADLRKRRLKPVDCVHAFLGLVVFLTIAGNDVGLQNCFFPYATDDTRQLFRNLPLGMAVMASFLFMIFPTTRKGIRFDKCELAPSGDTTTSKTKQEDQDVTKQGSEKEPSGVSPKDLEAQNPTVSSCDPKSKGTDQGNVAKKAADKLLDTSTNLLQLLPTGPVLAFQTLASSFTNQGKCYRSNWWLTVGLVIFLTATCVFFCFTDSVKDLMDNKKVHKGVALPRGLCILSTPKEDQKGRIDKAELRKRALKPVDWVHAFFTAVVFLTIAGSDVGLQNCFFPKANDNTKQMLKNLPLGMAVMSSFVFMIFPTTRKGICFDNSEYKIIDTRPASGDDSGTNSCNDGRR